MTSKPPVRESAVIDQPEQFVTVEIHNSTVRKKFRNHRESIINQMKHTETLLEQALNRDVQTHPHSRFTPANLPNQPLPRTLPSTPRQSHTTRGELSKKLKQLCNISQHFDRACEYRQSVLPTLHTCESTPAPLPLTFPREALPPSPTQRRAKEELAQHRTMVREWQAKVRLGRDFVKRAKLRHPLKLRKLNQQPPQVAENSKIPSLSSLRDLYFSQLRQERKTAPLANNRSLEMLFLRRGDQKGMGYVGQVQEQSALRLQRFIQGGEQGLGEYSDWLSLSDFRRSKENYQMLERLYNHVKETNLYEFKDMPAQRLKQQSLLSVVYYLQHGSNLSQGERRALRKKLRVVQ